MPPPARPTPPPEEPTIPKQPPTPKQPPSDLADKLDAGQFIDYYKLLGIDDAANNKQIESAYRRHILSSHPDKGGDPALFMLATAAKDTLLKGYDRYIYDMRLFRWRIRIG